MITGFRTVIIFISIAVCALSVLPKLDVDMLPKQQSNAFAVTFTVPGSSPLSTEMEVTSTLENSLAGISGIKYIRSTSYRNTGIITVAFKEREDLFVKRFEISSVIRQIYPKLFGKVSYPLITPSFNNREILERPSFIYTLHGNDGSHPITSGVIDYVKKNLANITGIKEVRISDTLTTQLNVEFDSRKCDLLGVTTDQILNTINNLFAISYPGKSNLYNNQYFIELSNKQEGISAIERSVIQDAPGNVMIKDVASISFVTIPPVSSLRINGNTAINLSIYIRDLENHIHVAKLIKERLNRIKLNDYQLTLEYDSTLNLDKELKKDYKRIFITLSVLLIFSILMYRRMSLILTLFVCLFVTFSLTILFIFVLGISINLYSVSAIAIAFSIVMDNIIVMLDYQIQHKGASVSTALLGATLTTIAILSLTFMLPDEIVHDFRNFSLIIATSLIASIIVCVWFLPSFLSILVKNKSFTRLYNDVGWRSRTLCKTRRAYFRWIDILSKKRFLLLISLLLLYGIPLHLMPSKIEYDTPIAASYNRSIGSDFYQQKIRPHIEVLLGGVSRVFNKEVFEYSRFQGLEQSRLFINLELLPGSLQDDIVTLTNRFEEHLKGNPNLDRFMTYLTNNQKAVIEISFKSSIEHTMYPGILKMELVELASELGDVQVSVAGVGKAFSNKNDQESPNFIIMLKGFNYDKLSAQVQNLVTDLQKHKRIQNINTEFSLNYKEKANIQYSMHLDRSLLATENIDRFDLYSALSSLTGSDRVSLPVTGDGDFLPVVIKDKNAESFSIYDLKNRPLKLDDNRVFKLLDAVEIKKGLSASAIYREDRQYVRLVSFEYNGSLELGTSYVDNVIKTMKKELPLGFTLEKKMDSTLKNTGNLFVLILLLIAMIWLICGILLGNLFQPLIIVSMIPLSFLGLFITFIVGHYVFDQGGYGSFAMLSGLMSNAAIFIVNEYNYSIRNGGGKTKNAKLISVIFRRSRTIVLTFIGAICSLIPFVMEGAGEPFWYSLAVGTIGGLIAGAVCIFILLPVLMWKK